MELTFTDRLADDVHRQVVQVFDDILDPAALASAYSYFKSFRRIAGSGEFWIKIESVRSDTADNELIGLGEFFGPQARFVVDYMRRLLTVFPAESIAGADVLELWFRFDRGTTKNDMVYLHTDSNHTAEDWEHNVRLPIWGTVLHLGPGSGITGGETSFCTERPMPESMVKNLHEYIPREQARGFSREWIDVGPRQNRLVIFRGSLPHYAAPVRSLASPDDPRLSLLVNVWDHLPIAASKLNGCSTMLPGEFRTISKISEAQLEQLREIAKRLTPSEIEVALEFIKKSD